MRRIQGRIFPDLLKRALCHPAPKHWCPHSSDHGMFHVRHSQQRAYCTVRTAFPIFSASFIRYVHMRKNTGRTGRLLPLRPVFSSSDYAALYSFPPAALHDEAGGREGYQHDAHDVQHTSTGTTGGGKLCSGMILYRKGILHHVIFCNIFVYLW